MLGLLCLGLTMVAGLKASDPTPLTPQDTRAAQKLYNTKCAKCHKFYNPDQYSDEDWKIWMDKMSRKSKLKPAQSELLSRYLDTLRKASPHPGG